MLVVMYRYFLPCIVGEESGSAYRAKTKTTFRFEVHEVARSEVPSIEHTRA